MSRGWPGYTAVWRWHFYAGLFCIPFVLWLALTGSVYLFRPQIEALIDRPYAHVAGAGPQAPIAAQVATAVRAVPGSVFHRYQLPDTRAQAVQVVVGRGARETRVYVNPQSLAVLKTVGEEDRLMRIVFRLHGELLIGDVGSYIVELAASWAIVMILSGLFLWWPRGAGMGGVVYPRLRARGRRFWRDLHGVTGFWVSLAALLLLLSGLPWAKSWGSYLKAIRTVAEGRATTPDWSIGAKPAGGDHGDHHGMAMVAPIASYAPLDRIAATVRPLDLAAPVLIAPPKIVGGPWTAKSDAADRPQRSDLTLDARGRIRTRKDFGERPLLDRIVGYGVAAHEGQLFGLANQIVSLATAMGLMLVSVSAVVLWWRRRPDGVLGAPPAAATARTGYGFVALLVVLGLLLPLLGVTMLAVLLIEHIVLAAMPGTRRWLGLPEARTIRRSSA